MATKERTTVTRQSQTSYRRMTESGNHSIWCCCRNALRLIDFRASNAAHMAGHDEGRSERFAHSYNLQDIIISIHGQ